MSEQSQKFLEDANIIAFDKRHRGIIGFNMSRYNAACENGKLQYKNLELARERAAYLKHRVVNDLDKYLIEFEAGFTAHGGKIIWAQDQDEAVKEILKILKKHEVRYAVKSKSMITEEIELNEHLKQNDIESLETDLGEYIVQLAEEKPYHIISPAMHKSKEDITALFNQKFGMPLDATPEQVTSFVRRLLRDKFISADVGITGANFLIADIAGVALTENEGNALMSVSFPKIHIAISGIEKIIPSLRDLHIFWPLLSTHGTGQKVTAYNTILTGPRQEGEIDGPEKMYLILMDNGRSNVLKRLHQRSALSCIKCGACLNGCPVYKNIGGHAYGTTYSGPIGSVLTPLMRGMGEYKHLSYASTLCGKCTEVCPVKINLHKLLLYNRNEAVKTGYVSRSEKFSMYVAKKVLMKRKRMETGNAKMKNYFLKKLFAKAWGDRRELPELQPKSFNRLWKEEKGIIKKK